MRSFEVAAMGAAVLAEDTEEHRLLYGESGLNVLFFNSVDLLQSQARWLLSHSEEGRKMGERLRRHIIDGGHTYEDRLRTMMAAI